MSLFDIKNKIKVNNNEIMYRLWDEVELVEFIDNYGNTELIFEDDFNTLEECINMSVISTYIEDRKVLYINKFYLELNDGRQAVIRVV